MHIVSSFGQFLFLPFSFLLLCKLPVVFNKGIDLQGRKTFVRDKREQSITMDQTPLKTKIPQWDCSVAAKGEILLGHLRQRLQTRDWGEVWNCIGAVGHKRATLCRFKTQDVFLLISTVKTENCSAKECAVILHTWKRNTKHIPERTPINLNKGLKVLNSTGSNHIHEEN